MGATVLVVDDDPMMGTIISASTVPLGISVAAALSVHAGLRILDAACATPPLALMTDIFMPEADAFDLMHALAERHCRVPIMLMSGGRPDYLPFARELGRVWGLDVVAALPKPIDRAQLQGYLGRLGGAAAPVPACGTSVGEHRVILVDDDADVRRALSGMLRSGGFEVIEASDGESALVELRTRSGIGLLLTDFRMPGMSGIELASEVKRLYPRIKILLLSGDQGVIFIPEVRFVAKPCTSHVLLDAVSSALEPGPAGSSSASRH